METSPLEVYAVHGYLQKRLYSLYESDNIFDKFDVQFSPNNRYLLTGSYNNNFRIIDRAGKVDLTYEASPMCVRNAPMLPKRAVRLSNLDAAPGSTRTCDQLYSPAKTIVDSLDEEHCNFSRKILHPVWNPSDDVIAIATVNNLYTFTADTTVPAPTPAPLDAADFVNGKHEALENM